MCRVVVCCALRILFCSLLVWADIGSFTL